jgi:hypothetical protein
MYSLISVKHVKQKKVLVLCEYKGKYLDVIRDGVIESFRGAGLGYKGTFELFEQISSNE